MHKFRGPLFAQLKPDIFYGAHKCPHDGSLALGQMKKQVSFLKH